LWGPYASLEEATKDGQTLATAHTPALASDYAAAPGFTFNTDVLAGEYYVLMVSNFGGAATEISLDTGAGTAGTDCGIPFNLNLSVSDPLATTTEAGATFDYTVSLHQAPTANVTVNIGTTTGEVTLSTPSLVFTPVNWETPQTVTLTAFDDLIFDGDKTDTVTHTTTSTDPNYVGKTAEVAAIAIDNENLSADPTVDSLLTNDSTPVLTGTAESGGTVSVIVNAVTYTEGDASGAVVDNGDGTWTLTIPAANPLADAIYDVAVSNSAGAFNRNDTTSDELTVDTTDPVPTISLNSITADNVVNAAEAAAPITVTGTVGGDFSAGDTVIVRVNEVNYPGTINAAGTFSIVVPGAEVAADTNIGANVETADAAGNVGSASTIENYTVDTTAPAPTLNINVVTADNIINTSESGAPVSITGTVVGEFAAGDIVTLTVDGGDYTGPVNAAGAFSIAIPGSSLENDGSVVGSISSTDAAGNVGTVGDNQVYSVDTTAPVITLAIADITADNIVNLAESGAPVTVTGTVAGDFTAGDTVNLSVDGIGHTGPVNAAGAFSIDVPGGTLAADTSVIGSVTSTDAAGNSSTTNDNQAYAVDTVVPVPTLSIDDVTADNVLNATEAASPVAITGTVGGDFSAGDTVTLTVNSVAYTGAVDAAGAFSVNVPGAALASDTSVAGSVSTTDVAGNPATAADTQLYTVDTTAPVVTLSVDDITADNVLNAAESGSSYNVTGTANGEFTVGDTVTLTINGVDYTGTVDAAGDYSIAVPGATLSADTSVVASISSADAAGNVTMAGETQPYAVDTTPPAITLTIDAIATDNVLNAAEAAAPVAVTGTVNGDFIAGDTVTLTVNSGDYSGTVNAAGVFSINVPGSELSSDTTVAASLSTTDAAGNSSTADDTQDYTVDTTAPAITLSVTDVTLDNVVNAAESTAPIAVTGAVSGEFTVGDTVTLTVNAADYTGTVDAAGAFSINIPGAELINDTDVLASITTVDAAGNATTAGDTQAYTIDITAPTVTLTVDDIATDNVLNAAEAAAPVTVTGSAGGDFIAGDTVTVSVNGVDYTAPLDAAGAYSLNVPGSELENDTSVVATVDTADAAGNPATASDTQPYAVDTTAPVVTLSVNNITADNVLNAAENGVTVAVTGTVAGDFTAGDTVTLTVNGVDYTGVVDAAGAYSIDIPGSELVSDTSVVGSVSSTDAAGNTSSVGDTQLYTVDTSAPVINVNIDPVTVDNVLNAPEAAVVVPITGAVSGEFVIGDTVTLTVNGVDYSGTVDAAGAYSIDIPGSELAADTTVTASLTTIDAAGNATTAIDTQNYAIDATAPNAVLTLNEVTTDNVVNIAEAAAPVAITGTVSGEFTAGDTVTLTINGTDYAGTVDATGEFSIDVPGAELANDVNVVASVTASDAAGNTASAGSTKAYTVDTAAPVVTLALNAIATDNVLNAAEASAAVTITGTAAGDFNAGDTVTLTVNGVDYSGSVNAVGDFSIDVPGSELANDSSVVAGMTSVDAAGNTTTAIDTAPYAVDTIAPVISVTLATVATDNILNAAEAGAPVPLTGTVAGDFIAGDTVTLTVNGIDYIGPVNAAGEFSIDVPGSELASDSNVVASMSAADAAGNTTTAGDTQPFMVDTIAPVVALSVADISTDNVINAAESAAPVTVTGTATGDFSVGDTVTLTVNGADYTGTVDAAGNFSISIPGSELANDSSVAASITSTDVAGNSTIATDTKPYTVDTTAPSIAVTVDDVTADNILSAAESTAPVTLTGSVTGDYTAGETVTLTVNAMDYTGTVDATGAFSIDVPGTELSNDTNIDASITSTDAAGNATTATATQPYTVDTAAPALTLSVNDITADNVLNAADSAAPVAITGTVTGDFVAGDIVTLTVNGVDYAGPVDAAGNYSIDVPGSELASDMNIAASLTSTDIAGNSTTVADTQNYSVDTVAPVIVLMLDSVTADNILNAGEAVAAMVPMTGSVSGDFLAGDTATLTVNGIDYAGPVDAAGLFSIDIPGSELALDTTVIASLTTTDAAGNSTTANDTGVYTVDTVAPVAALTLNDVTADNVLNATEVGAPVAVSGSVSGEFSAGDTVTLTVNGNDFTGTVDAAGEFSIDVPGADLANDFDILASVEATDPAGNTSTANNTQAYTIDSTVPSIVLGIDPVSADNVVNAVEAGVTVALTGTVNGEFNEGDTVTLTVNGVDYTGTVDATGAYSIDVPGSELANDSAVAASISTADAAGNTTTSDYTQPYSVDVIAPAVSLSVNPITSDNVLNAADSTASVAISGTAGGDVSAGDIVTLTVNGIDYTGAVDAAGNYSIDVPGTELANNTIVVASLTTADAAGNVTTVGETQPYAVDTIAPALTLSLNDVATDNVLNSAESVAAVTITGTAAGDFSAGDTVVITVNGIDYTGTVDATGAFSVDVPGSELAIDSAIAASMTTSDAAGNASTATNTQGYSVDTLAPVASLALDSATTDNILNAAEVGAPVTITGTVSGDFQVGDTVTITVNGSDYTGTVDAAGDFSIAVAGSELANDVEIVANVTVTDASGNSSTAGSTQAYTVDATVPAVVLTVDAIATDNVLNAAEAGTTVPVSGSVTGDFNAGDTVSLTVNGMTYTGTVDAAGNYSIDVPGNDLASDTSVVASVTSNDIAGNTSTADSTQAYSVDTAAPVVGLVVDPIATDNVLNALESSAPVPVTGTVTGDFTVGDTVTLTINGFDYTGVVDAAGNFSIDVPGSELADDTNVAASITIADAAGNESTSSSAQPYSVDTIPPAVTLTVDIVATDNVLNALEASASVAITGSVTGDFTTGDTVIVTVNGIDYTGAVDAAGSYSIDVPGSELANDTIVTASLTTADSAGNSVNANNTQAYSIDTTAPTAELTLNAITTDNVLNAVDAAAPVAITGSVTGEFQVGDTVTLTVNGTDYAGTLDASGEFSIDVPGSELASDSEVIAAVTATDAAGNSAAADSTQTYAVDTTAPSIAIAVNPVGMDNIVNAAEAGATVAITGSVSGDFVAGDTVTLTVNGVEYTGTVDTTGAYSIDVPGSELASDSTVEASTTTSDSAGNATTTDITQGYTVDTIAPVIALSIDPIATDNVVNAAEGAAPVSITRRYRNN